MEICITMVVCVHVCVCVLACCKYVYVLKGMHVDIVLQFVPTRTELLTCFEMDKDASI